jgi:nucleoside-diphosphate-sugar epimerase
MGGKNHLNNVNPEKLHFNILNGDVIIVTGASGFIGSSLVIALSESLQIVGLDKHRPSNTLVKAAKHVKWTELNISDTAEVNSAFQLVKDDYGRIDFVIHLAAYYHFGIDWQKEYELTNIKGTENICNAAVKFGARRIIFSSSIAALEPPEHGQYLNEESLTSDYIPYARSKSEGEKIIKNISSDIPVTILRLGGVFSDWCELPPLYSLIRLWSSFIPFANMVPGNGETGIPYIHIKDVIQIIQRCIALHSKLSDCEIFIASQNGAVLHKDLFPCIKAALDYGGSNNPIYVSTSVAKIALRLKSKLGRLTGRINFEQPWMLKYTDRPWIVNNAYTQEKLAWRTSSNLDLLERLPVILNFYKEQRKQWISQNKQRIFGKYVYKHAQV